MFKKRKQKEHNTWFVQLNYPSTKQEDLISEWTLTVFILTALQHRQAFFKCHSPIVTRGADEPNNVVVKKRIKGSRESSVMEIWLEQ